MCLLVHYIKQQLYCTLESESLFILFAASEKAAHTTE